ncbi:Exochitinase 1 [Streptomyces sp. RB5]|uniref:chitinase n=1 Tax=Streptomyces smaragdinus TaxID=2585196 RepID=A0A7K0CAB3_9ACTN|nr:glycoside hydrolase family 18 protein [Streptomyces smaragdinus]MQY10333.1 Exochitinase 1 [Streptomyces smaragdinus]
MDRTRPFRTRIVRLIAILSAALLSGALLSAAGPASAADGELAVNGGFESGLSGWNCSGSTGTTVGSPVHGGSAALKATPTAGDNAKCGQTVNVQPNSTYTLGAWVQGSYVYLGVEGTGTTASYVWTPSATSWQKLSLSFTTNATASTVTIYTHGWYGVPAYTADDVSLFGPGGGPGNPQPPTAPTGLGAGSATASSIALSWSAVSGASSYNVYQDGARIKSVTSPSTTVTGLAASTAYSFQVTAVNSAGESAKSAAVTASTTSDGGGNPPGGDLPAHALVGYLHASFANGSGYTRMADVPDSWDIINLAFGEPTSVTSGDIRFSLCPQTECPGVESLAEFKAAIAAKRAAGKKVLLSIGGQNGQVQLTSTAARDAFVSSVSSIIDTYGLDGVDIDFEGHSLSLNTGDTDFRNPTTPVIVNLISALKSLKAKYGSKFVLTMAPETFFVQMGYQFYGSGQWGGQDPRCGAYLPVIYAMRDDLTLLHVQDYNSGPIMGLDNQYHTMGSSDFHIAMTDMLLTGFPVAGNTSRMFPALRPEQVAFGLPASQNAGNGYTSPADVTKVLDCLTKGSNCGSYATHGRWPALRGLMTWSINWDRYSGYAFQHNFDSYFP